MRATKNKITEQQRSKSCDNFRAFIENTPAHASAKEAFKRPAYAFPTSTRKYVGRKV